MVGVQSWAIPLFGLWSIFKNSYRFCCRACRLGWGCPGRGDYSGGGKFENCQAGLLGVLQDFAMSGNKVLAPSKFYSWPSICFEIFYGRIPKISGIFPSLDRRNEGDSALKMDLNAELRSS